MKKRIRRSNNNGQIVPFLPADLRPHRLLGTPKRPCLGEFDNDQSPTPFGAGADHDLADQLPIDLFPRDLARPGTYPAGAGPGSSFDKDEYISKIANDTGILVATQTIDRGLIGRSVTVGTSPTRIIQSTYPRAYIIMNPSLIVGGTAVGALVDSAARVTDDSSDFIGVANYRDMHLFLDVTAVSGTTPTLDIYAQALDPVTLNWADTQLLYSGIAATGTYYSNPGSLGLGTDFRVRWVLGGTTPNFTFSVGYVLKEGLPGTGAGVGKTLYIGNSGVSVSAGFPLLEGQSRSFFMKENTELWAVANTSLDLRVFEL